MTAVGYPRVQPRSALDRVLARIQVDDNGCWIWPGAKSSNGYGMVGLGGHGKGTAFTHRVTWEAENGPVLDGHDLDHLCRVRACCNPAHLEPVTRQENVDRGLRAKGYRDRETCPQGHPLDGVRNDRHGNFRQRFCKTCKNEGKRRARAEGKHWARSR
jgi:hypothetical protein